MGKMKAILGSGIALVVTFAAEAIANALKSLGKIPFIGALFKFIATPFSFLAGFKTVCMVILGIILFFVIGLPIIKKIFAAIGKLCKKKVSTKREDALLSEMEEQQFTESINYGGPSKIDF